MANLPQIKKTSDGSNTLFLPDLNETYHSLHGALSESLHVYIKNGFNQVIQQKSSEIYIFEIGFGTAMNALLTMDVLPENTICYYYSLEPFLPDFKLIQQYYSDFEALPNSIQHLKSMYEVQNQWLDISKNFKLFVSTLTLEDLDIHQVLHSVNHQFDLVYYDAFAPSKQPELWSLSSIEKIKGLMKDNALLTTYCAQGQFKRNLKSLNFEVSHPQGANGKREMTIAVKK